MSKDDFYDGRVFGGHVRSTGAAGASGGAGKPYLDLADHGLRFDEGKLRLDLIPPEWVLALGKVLTCGANKYADRNWEKGMPWSKVWGPLLRHAFKWLSGETYDQENGCHHLAIVAWNALALMTYQMRGIGENNMPGPHYLRTAWVRDLLPESAIAPQEHAPPLLSPVGRPETPRPSQIGQAPPRRSGRK